MPIQTIRSQRLYRQIADQLQQLIRDGEVIPPKNNRGDKWNFVT
ncbi:hypothetical protein ACFO0E_06295 [Chromohalobacter beijerinckii]|uniref:GntR family transcriptional regulator n=1 Tax=Chromohalobacter beijerinckii TaxID=86179 RepID=A0ABV8XB74_9GAMM